MMNITLPVIATNFPDAINMMVLCAAVTMVSNVVFGLLIFLRVK